MRPAYDNDLTFLRDWIRDTNNLLLGGQTVVIYPQTYLQVKTAIQNVEFSIQHEYPFSNQFLTAEKKRSYAKNDVVNVFSAKQYAVL